MSLFGQLVRTTLNIAALPVAVALDIVTLGGALDGREETYSQEALEKLKREAEDEEG